METERNGTGHLLAFLGLASAGLVLVLGGLAWDAAMHAADPHLAEQEGIFTLSNPSHALFATGLALAAAGIVGAILTAARARPAGSRLRRRGVRAAIAGGAAVLILAAGGLGAWAQSSASSHAHDVAAASEDEEGEDSHDTMPGATARDHHARGGDVASATPEQRAAAQRLLDDTIAATAAYRDPAAAEAAGYVFLLDGPPHVYHVPNPAYRRDGRVLDPEHPESLLYVRNPADESLVLVGVVYRMEEPGKPGPTIGGPITVWHDHSGCLDHSSRTRTEAPPDGTCPEGTITRTGVDMMHVWFTGDLETAFGRKTPVRDLIEYQRVLTAEEAAAQSRQGD
jgi:hypothetical protein